ncbi:hypothetical protein COD67_19235 [Bacillus cereus]|nr:hypothetical protein COI89_21245 [Bacillus cereus]PGU64157.1 hypothetical protein COD67_19235 [Bacillus cereus]
MFFYPAKARLVWANNQWGWTKPPLIKVSLYCIKYMGRKIHEKKAEKPLKTLCYFKILIILQMLEF